MHCYCFSSFSLRFWCDRIFFDSLLIEWRCEHHIWLRNVWLDFHIACALSNRFWSLILETFLLHRSKVIIEWSGKLNQSLCEATNCLSCWNTKTDTSVVSHYWLTYAHEIGLLRILMSICKIIFKSMEFEEEEAKITNSCCSTKSSFDCVDLCWRHRQTRWIYSFMDIQ